MKKLKIFLLFVGTITTLTAAVIMWNYYAAQHAIQTEEKSQVVSLTNQVACEISPLIQELKSQVALVAKNGVSNTPESQTSLGLGKKEHNQCTYTIVKDGTRLSAQDNALCNTVLLSGFRVTYDATQDAFVLVYAQTVEQRTFFATLSLNILKKQFEEKETAAISYWLIADENDNILMHPQARFLKQIHTITQMTGLSLKDIKESDYQHNFTNEATKRNAWLSCAPIEDTGLYICSVVDENQTPFGPDQHRRTLINLTLLLGVALVCFVLLFLLRYLPIGPRLLWSSAACVSMFTISAIGMIWLLNYRYPDYKRKLTPLIRSQQVDNITAENKQARWHIPTGLLVTHAQFEQEGKISVVGYVWQRYDHSLPKTIVRGFMLPQAIHTSIEKVSTVTHGNTDIIVWRVEATLNQYLTYARYPFDVKTLRIQVWTKEFDEHVLLTPDLNAYPLVYPDAQPGIGPNMHIDGWSIAESYFAYHTNNYQTNFGLYTAQDHIYRGIHKTESVDLYFDINLQRHLLQTIINNLLPLMVVALLLFVILLTSVWQGYAIIASCSSVFFGTVLAQVRLHETILSSQLVYFDNFYFPMYFAILVILTVSLLYHLEFRIGAIRYKRNLIAKLLYWPVLTLTLLLITLVYLY